MDTLVGCSREVLAARQRLREAVAALKVPRLTVGDIIPRLKKEAVLMQRADVVLLSDGAGFINLTDDDGGTAYLVDANTEKILVSVRVEITTKMREE